MMTELPPLSELQTREAMYALLVSMYQELVALRAENARLRAENEELKRMLFGQRSERVEPIERELQKKGDKRTPQQKKQQQQRKRQQRQEQKKKLPEKKVIHKVAEDELQCPSCGGEKFVDVGSGDESVEYEFVPAQIIKIVHVREKKACTCGSHIVTAPGPSRVVEGCQYGPGLHAHVAVSKCQDGLPLYRQSKQFGRAGFSIPKSSLGDLFHRTADLLRPCGAGCLSW